MQAQARLQSDRVPPVNVVDARDRQFERGLALENLAQPLPKTSIIQAMGLILCPAFVAFGFAQSFFKDHPVQGGLLLWMAFSGFALASVSMGHIRLLQARVEALQTLVRQLDDERR